MIVSANHDETINFIFRLADGKGAGGAAATAPWHGDRQQSNSDVAAISRLD